MATNFFVEYEYRILHISVPIEKIIFAKKTELTLSEREKGIFLWDTINAASTIRPELIPLSVIHEATRSISTLH